VQFGVNMQAQAICKLQRDREDDYEIGLFEVYEVVLYMGIIDMLQEYNVKKKLEHAYKSFKFDPLTIQYQSLNPSCMPTVFSISWRRFFQKGPEEEEEEDHLHVIFFFFYIYI
jgi:hypothetical protein